jgi:integrase
MSETTVRRRRPRGEDAIYFAAAKNRYVGSVSLGYGPDGKRIRRTVSGKTNQEVRDRLKALHKEMDAGVRSSKTYTVREAVEDWLREGLDGTSERTRTLCEGLLGPLLDAIGARPLRVLSAGDVRSGPGKLADRYSTRSLQITRLLLERAIRHAEAGTPLSANNVIRAFRIITRKAGLGEDWVPREMRHTFVSVLSANGVPVESIALLAGHERTATTESVYRHEIRPALTQGAEVMDKIFG